MGGSGVGDGSSRGARGALAAAIGGCSQHCCSPPEVPSRTTFASLHNDRDIKKIHKSKTKEILQHQRFLRL